MDSNGNFMVLNPGYTMGDKVSGWLTSDQISSGIFHLVVVDTNGVGVAGGVSAGGSYNYRPGYQAVIATWNRVDRTTTYDAETGEDAAQDLGIQIENGSLYTMSTTKINYEDMVAPYTMPFDYLWSLFVLGQSKGFIMDLADLVYGSDIEVSVYDNLTTITDVDNYKYKEPVNMRVYGSIIYDDVNYKYGRVTSNRYDVEKHEHKDIIVDSDGNIDSDSDQNTVSGYINKTVVTYNNTATIALTRAHTWVADYDLAYSYSDEMGTDHTELNELEDQSRVHGASWSTFKEQDDCELVQEVVKKVRDEANQIYIMKLKQHESKELTATPRK